MNPQLPSNSGELPVERSRTESNHVRARFSREELRLHEEYLRESVIRHPDGRIQIERVAAQRTGFLSREYKEGEARSYRDVPTMELRSGTLRLPYAACSEPRADKRCVTRWSLPTFAFTLVWLGSGGDWAFQHLFSVLTSGELMFTRIIGGAAGFLAAAWCLRRQSCTVGANAHWLFAGILAAVMFPALPVPTPIADWLPTLQVLLGAGLAAWAFKPLWRSNVYRAQRLRESLRRAWGNLWRRPSFPLEARQYRVRHPFTQGLGVNIRVITMVRRVFSFRSETTIQTSHYSNEPESIRPAPSGGAENTLLKSASGKRLSNAGTPVSALPKQLAPRRRAK